MTGTFELSNPNALSPGDRWFIDLDTYPAGPSDKRGYLSKRGPFDGVVFDNYSSLVLFGNADGMESPIPSDAARTLDSQPVAGFVSVTNPSSNTSTLAAGDLSVLLFGTPGGSREANRLQFSGQAVISDLVPGVTTGGHDR